VFLRDFLDGHLLTANRGLRENLELFEQIEPQNVHWPPPYQTEEMKLPLDQKLVQTYVKKLKHGDIIELCRENDFRFEKNYFPKRHIRQARGNLIKLIEKNLGLNYFAEVLARDILECHLSSLDQDGFKAFFTKLDIAEDEIKEMGEQIESPTVDDILDMVDDSFNIFGLALKLGVHVLFPEEKEDVDDQPELVEKTDEYDKLWNKLESPPGENNSQSPDFTSNQKRKSAQKKGPSISKVLSEYLQEMITANAWTEKTKMEVKSTIDKLIDIIGDIDVGILSFELARKYKRTLAKLPSNMRKDARYRDLSVKEILRMEDVKPIAINTINNNIAKVIAFMNWTKRNGYISENYFEGLKVKNKKKATEERKPFNEADVKKIFKTKIYLPETESGPARFWIPLLGLFTGARLNELCQLHVEDIKKEDGIWCIDINDNSDDPGNPKKLKNKASKRVIPVHPKLIEIGFIDFVQEQRKLKTVRLFPELSFSIDGYSRKVGRWFNAAYLRKKVGIKDPEKSFHSFRHTVIDGLKQKGVGESYISEYVGHSSGESETFGRYGKQYQPKVLMDEVVKRIEYGVNIKKLIKDESK